MSKAAQVYESPRARAMTMEYGEWMDKTTARNILGVSPGTICAMCKDGRLDGTRYMVSVRSIAKYLDNDRPTAQSVKRQQQAKVEKFLRVAP